ncbi:Allantoicase [Didymella exigua CBS 183.55]|uniref:Allantoicase n=1 Tax=Didymella exigua CBS 183.55 TaxID=1150837 RepID=A0A6A5RV90_9PLEO|nr:Allantoicase [Didymella exigua CBS 183.55]KAF1931782.1 Allantoicase [Didymella exigua CBS 183.55]
MAATPAKFIPADQIDSTFKSKYTDLISAPLGSKIVSCSDEFFAAAENLITKTAPISRPGVFVHSGAWYDGWETRRHNTAAADWVIIRLGTASGKIAGVEIDTAFFNGNHAPEIAVEGAFADSDEVVAAEGFAWDTILSRQECGPSQRHGWLLDQITAKAYTHVRLLMYPDGGIARFRLYGTAVPVFPADTSAVLELSATVMGGVATACSDQHFGTKDNLLLPGRGVDMGDGWETKRTRGDHVDWTTVRLGAACAISSVVVDTAHFRGNFPQKVQVYAGSFEADPAHDDAAWVEVLSPQASAADVERTYKDELRNVQGQKYTHAKLVIIPDGGVKRFRVFGTRV